MVLTHSENKKGPLIQASCPDGRLQKRCTPCGYSTSVSYTAYSCYHYFLRLSTHQGWLEYSGIKMDVVSADIYITMQDLTGNRIDSTTGLNNNYSINHPFGGSASCYFSVERSRIVDFEERMEESLN